MRKSILAAAVTGALAIGGTAHASLSFDLNGSGAGGVISADSFDWSQTSFLAKGGNSAISAFASGACAATPSLCQFDVLTHATLTGYKLGSSTFSLPAGVGEITMVARYTESVTAVTPGAGGTILSATFSSTGTGWLEFYWSGATNSNDLTGNGFNDGTLIGRLEGVQVGRIGSFLVTSTTGVPLDGSGDGDQYPGQLTVEGFGSQQSLLAGTTSKDLDGSFFLTTIAGFTIQYENISIGLPYGTANPSDCFNDAQSGSAVGTAGLSSTCNTTHVLGKYSDQSALDPGYLPVVGDVNGLGLGNPDFVAQTDFNSAVNGVPEPGTLALVGLAVGAMGFAARRRRTA